MMWLRRKLCWIFGHGMYQYEEDVDRWRNFCGFCGEPTPWLSLDDPGE